MKEIRDSALPTNAVRLTKFALRQPAYLVGAPDLPKSRGFLRSYTLARWLITIGHTSIIALNICCMKHC